MRLSWIWHIATYAVCGMALAGCVPGVEPPAYQLTPPPKRCMLPPKPLPVVKEGDDLYQDNASVSAAYRDTSGKLVCVQGWAATVLKKK